MFLLPCSVKSLLNLPFTYLPLCFHLLSFITVSLLQHLPAEIPLRANKYQVTVGKFIGVSGSYLLHCPPVLDAVAHTTLEIVS